MTAPMCYNLPHTTKFYQYNMDELKAMVANSDHELVKTVGDNWQWIRESLVGGSHGGIKGEFDAAVSAVLETWSGDAAEAFAKRAQKISENIGKAAPYAQGVGNVMWNAAAALKAYKPELDAIKKPTQGESTDDAAGNAMLAVVTLGTKGGRDDEKAKRELEAGVRTEDVLNGNSGELSEGKERQLKCAMVMELLGGSYRSNAAAMGKAPAKGLGDNEDIPEIGNMPPITPVVPVPSSISKPGKIDGQVGNGVKTGSANTSPKFISPNVDGITGGVSKKPPTTSIPSSSISSPSSTIKTGLDGFNPSASGVGSGGGGAFGTTSGVGAGGTGSGGGTTGMPGGPGGAVPRSGAARTGTGAGTGRMGTPGGMGGGAGAGAGAGKGGSGRGSLAKQRGGVVGAAGGKSGGSPQGGSGLHRSRGGTQGGTTGSRGPGMAGAPGGRGGRNEENSSEGERPDYLVEDEETWMSERNVAPRVIE